VTYCVIRLIVKYFFRMCHIWTVILDLDKYIFLGSVLCFVGCYRLGSPYSVNMVIVFIDYETHACVEQGI